MRRSLAAAALASLAAIACAAPDEAPRDATADDGSGAPARAAECADCHVEHAREHAGSAHARAFTNLVFQREWSLRRDPFCVPCHAPRTSDPDLEPELARAGVDCASCHAAADGAIRAARASGRAPHPTVIDPVLATTDACESCHQVDVPGLPGVALQDTVAEWHAAGEPGGECQTCHLPREGERHAHDLPGGHDVATLRAALAITVHAERDGAGTRVVIRLDARSAAHAIPTGDVHRRLLVRAEREEGGGGSVVELGRHLERSPTRDDRVPAGGARELVLRVRGRPARVRWSVEMWSLPAASAAESRIPSELLRRPFASGTIDVE